MATGWIEKVMGSLEQKKRYRQYKARSEQLPANYRTAIEALEVLRGVDFDVARSRVRTRRAKDMRRATSRWNGSVPRVSHHP